MVFGGHIDGFIRSACQFLRIQIGGGTRRVALPFMSKLAAPLGGIMDMTSMVASPPYRHQTSSTVRLATRFSYCGSG